MPSLLMASGDNSFYLYFHSEQTPDRRNRIELDPGAVDAVGMPRLRIEAALLEADAEAILRAHALIGHELRAAGVGDLEFLDPDDPKLTLRRDCTATLGHHIGGARMAVAAEDGVVDPDLKVHGLDNLYVASAAALPVSSQAHPTLTVLALALRLARHLGRP
jgi:choline dehydrogenase-like flavoprotein